MHLKGDTGVAGRPKNRPCGPQRRQRGLCKAPKGAIKAVRWVQRRPKGSQKISKFNRVPMAVRGIQKASPIVFVLSVRQITLLH